MALCPNPSVEVLDALNERFQSFVSFMRALEQVDQIRARTLKLPQSLQGSCQVAVVLIVHVGDSELKSLLRPVLL